MLFIGMRKKEKEKLTKSMFVPTYEVTSHRKVDQLVKNLINDLERKHSRSGGCFFLFTNNCPYNEQCKLTGPEMCPHGLLDIKTNKDYYQSESRQALERILSILKPYTNDKG